MSSHYVNRSTHNHGRRGLGLSMGEFENSPLSSIEKTFLPTTGLASNRSIAGDLGQQRKSLHRTTRGKLYRAAATVLSVSVDGKWRLHRIVAAVVRWKGYASAMREDVARGRLMDLTQHSRLVNAEKETYRRDASLVPSLRRHGFHRHVALKLWRAGEVMQRHILACSVHRWSKECVGAREEELRRSVPFKEVSRPIAVAILVSAVTHRIRERNMSCLNRWKYVKNPKLDVHPITLRDHRRIGFAIASLKYWLQRYMARRRATSISKWRKAVQLAPSMQLGRGVTPVSVTPSPPMTPPLGYDVTEFRLRCEVMEEKLSSLHKQRSRGMVFQSFGRWVKDYVSSREHTNSLAAMTGVSQLLDEQFTRRNIAAVKLSALDQRIEVLSLVRFFNEWVQVLEEDNDVTQSTPASSHQPKFSADLVRSTEVMLTEYQTMKHDLLSMKEREETLSMRVAETEKGFYYFGQIAKSFMFLERFMKKLLMQRVGAALWKLKENVVGYMATMDAVSRRKYAAFVARWVAAEKLKTFISSYCRMSNERAMQHWHWALKLESLANERNMWKQAADEAAQERFEIARRCAVLLLHSCVHVATQHNYSKAMYQWTVTLKNQEILKRMTLEKSASHNHARVLVSSVLIRRAGAAFIRWYKSNMTQQLYVTKIGYEFEIRELNKKLSLKRIEGCCRRLYSIVKATRLRRESEAFLCMFGVSNLKRNQEREDAIVNHYKHVLALQVAVSRCTMMLSRWIHRRLHESRVAWATHVAAERFTELTDTWEALKVQYRYLTHTLAATKGRSVMTRWVNSRESQAFGAWLLLWLSERRRERVEANASRINHINCENYRTTLCLNGSLMLHRSVEKMCAKMKNVGFGLWSKYVAASLEYEFGQKIAALEDEYSLLRVQYASRKVISVLQSAITECKTIAVCKWKDNFGNDRLRQREQELLDDMNQREALAHRRFISSSAAWKLKCSGDVTRLRMLQVGLGDWRVVHAFSVARQLLDEIGRLKQLIKWRGGVAMAAMWRNLINRRVSQSLGCWRAVIVSKRGEQHHVATRQWAAGLFMMRMEVRWKQNATGGAMSRLVGRMVSHRGHDHWTTSTKQASTRWMLSLIQKMIGYRKSMAIRMMSQSAFQTFATETANNVDRRTAALLLLRAVDSWRKRCLAHSMQRLMCVCVVERGLEALYKSKTHTAVVWLNTWMVSYGRVSMSSAFTKWTGRVVSIRGWTDGCDRQRKAWLKYLDRLMHHIANHRCSNGLKVLESHAVIVKGRGIQKSLRSKWAASRSALLIRRYQYTCYAKSLFILSSNVAARKAFDLRHKSAAKLLSKQFHGWKDKRKFEGIVALLKSRDEKRLEEVRDELSSHNQDMEAERQEKMRIRQELIETKVLADNRKTAILSAMGKILDTTLKHHSKCRVHTSGAYWIVQDGKEKALLLRKTGAAMFLIRTWEKYKTHINIKVMLMWKFTAWSQKYKEYYDNEIKELFEILEAVKQQKKEALEKAKADMDNLTKILEDLLDQLAEAKFEDPNLSRVGKKVLGFEKEALTQKKQVQSDLRSALAKKKELAERGIHLTLSETQALNSDPKALDRIILNERLVKDDDSVLRVESEADIPRVVEERRATRLSEMRGSVIPTSWVKQHDEKLEAVHLKVRQYKPEMKHKKSILIQDLNLQNDSKRLLEVGATSAISPRDKNTQLDKARVAAEIKLIGARQSHGRRNSLVLRELLNNVRAAGSQLAKEAIAEEEEEPSEEDHEESGGMRASLSAREQYFRRRYQKKTNTLAKFNEKLEFHESLSARRGQYREESEEQ